MGLEAKRLGFFTWMNIWAKALLPGQERSVQSLSAVLELIKTKNLSIQQTIFYVDAIVTRLSILGRLILALPIAKNSMRSQFIELSNSFSAYLQTCTEKEIPAVPNDLVIRLHNLEQNTLMMYIKIAKGDSTDLSAKSFERLKNDVATISAALDLEKTEAAFELEKWTGISTQAEKENQSLLHVVAQNRTARCSEIIKLTEQTIEVLNVTVSMAESRAQKSKAS